MHPERRLGRVASFPDDTGSVKEIHIPGHRVKIQCFGVQVAELTLGIPGMGCLEPVEPHLLLLGRLKAVSGHHRHPNDKTFQVCSGKLLKDPADSTLSVLAHGSGRGEQGNQPNGLTGTVEFFP